MTQAVEIPIVDIIRSTLQKKEAKCAKRKAKRTRFGDEAPTDADADDIREVVFTDGQGRVVDGPELPPAVSSPPKVRLEDISCA